MTPSASSSSHGVSGRLAAVVAVVALRASTASRRTAGLALRARAPSLPPPPLLPCEGTRPSRHPSLFTRRARPSGRCFDRRCTGADPRQARGGRGVCARAPRLPPLPVLLPSGPRAVKQATASMPRPSIASLPRGVGGRRAAVVAVVALRAPTACMRAAGWLRAHARASRRRHCLRVKGRGHRAIPRSYGGRGRLAYVLIVAARAPISFRRAAHIVRLLWIANGKFSARQCIRVGRARLNLIAPRHPAHLCLGSLIASPFLRWAILGGLPGGRSNGAVSPLHRPPGRSRPHAGCSRHAFDPNNKWQVSRTTLRAIAGPKYAPCH